MWKACIGFGKFKEFQGSIPGQLGQESNVFVNLKDPLLLTPGTTKKLKLRLQTKDLACFSFGSLKILVALALGCLSTWLPKFSIA